MWFKLLITFKFAERYYIIQYFGSTGISGRWSGPGGFTYQMHCMTDEQYMQQALAEAQKAYDAEEVPVGAIVVMNNRIIARAHNQVELLNDSTAHAEILALTTAFNFLGSKYLPEASIYITLEPCLMCSGALFWSKIGKIVFGADDEKHGYKKCGGFSSRGGGREGAPFHPKTVLVGGVLKDDCASLIKNFFKARR